MADPITDPANPTPPVPPVAPPVAPTPPAPSVDPVDPPLGEAGQRALVREREAAAEARREAAAVKAELETLRAAHQTDQEKALTAARAEGAAEVSAKFANQVLLSEIRVAAAGKLADPTDAVRLLDLTKFTVAADGTVDVTAITSAIDALVQSKPYLAAGKSPAAPGSGDQGRRGNPAGEITQAQLKTMTSAEIEAHRKAGRLDHLLR